MLLRLALLWLLLVRRSLLLLLLRLLLLLLQALGHHHLLLHQHLLILLRRHSDGIQGLRPRLWWLLAALALLLHLLHLQLHQVHLRVLPGSKHLLHLSEQGRILLHCRGELGVDHPAQLGHLLVLADLRSSLGHLHLQ